MKLFLSRAHYPIFTLGPGARLGIWFQGCSIRCPGCISVDTWDGARGATTVEDLLESIGPWISLADGITVSGGEPFDQEDALHDLLFRVRKFEVGGRLKPLDILVYSGYPWEQLASKVGLSGRFMGLIDGLLTDPFLATAPQTLALRGSDNQRLHFITPLGEERFKSHERAITASDRTMDFMVGDDGEVWLAGIPLRGDMKKLLALLGSGGHDASTSEGRVPESALQVPPNAKRAG